MNDLQIDYFLNVVKNTGFTKAASELFVTQPAVSRQIALMEEELGVTLFDRTKRTTKLTKAGEMFYEFYSKYRSDFLDTLNAAKKYNGEAHGTLTIGCAENWDLTSFIPAIFKKFHVDYPHVDIQLESRAFRELSSNLKNDLLDAIITIDVTLRDTKFNIRKLTDIPRILLYPKNHPQAGLQNLQIIDFRDSVFFVPNEFEGVRDYVKVYCAQYGFEPDIQIVPNTESAIAKTSTGFGVFISDYWSRDRINPSFRYITLDSMHTISIAWRKNSVNPLIELLVNELILIFNQKSNDNFLEEMD